MTERKETLQNRPSFIVLGSNGFVGNFTSEQLIGQNYDVKNLTRDDLDISRFDPNEHSNLPFINSHDVLLNFAAYTNVDEAEKQKGDKNGTAWKTNVEGLRSLAKLAEEKGAFLINIGTDFEFTGTEKHNGPYTEDELEKEVDKLSWYGYTKAIGLNVLMNSGANFAHIRISYPYGGTKNSNDFMNRTKGYVLSGYELFNDQIITPTNLSDLLEAIEVISEKQLGGIYHVASPTSTTPYDFAKKITEKEVKQGSLKEFLKSHPQLAPRPIFGGLDVNKTQNLLGVKFV